MNSVLAFVFSKKSINLISDCTGKSRKKDIIRFSETTKASEEFPPLR